MNKKMKNKNVLYSGNQNLKGNRSLLRPTRRLAARCRTKGPQALRTNDIGSNNDLFTYLHRDRVVTAVQSLEVS